MEKDFYISYEKSDIPQELIDECDELAIRDSITYFIFDNSTTDFIKNLNKSKSEQRDILLDNILSKENKIYHIGTDDEFKKLPSRFAYYDTEIKLTGRYDRYNYVVNFLNELTFKPSISNVGPEYEQSFILSCSDCKFIIRIRPNLFVNLISQNEYGMCDIYDGFFNSSKIINAIESKSKSFIEILRDYKLKKIIDSKI